MVQDSYMKSRRRLGKTIRLLKTARKSHFKGAEEKSLLEI